MIRVADRKDQVVGQCTLLAEYPAHQRERIGRHVRFDVRAQAGQDAMVEAQLSRRHAVPHLHLDDGRNRNVRAAARPDIERLQCAGDRVDADLSRCIVLPAGAVDECDVGPISAVARVRGRVDRSCRRSYVVIVDQRAERAAELPSGVAGAGKDFRRTPGKAQCHQLILGAEVRLCQPADAGL